MAYSEHFGLATALSDDPKSAECSFLGDNS